VGIPYITVNTIGSSGVTVFGLLLMSALLVGGFTMVRAGKRLGVPVDGTVALAALCVGVAVVTSHVFDVAFYQWDDAVRDPKLWIRISQGTSLFGALLGVSITVYVWARVRRLDLAIHADIVAVGCIVAMAIGRLGCALVHDHPGTPTSAPTGVDFPIETVLHLGHDQPRGTTIRLHDLGLYELALMLPLVVAAFVLIRRRSRAGMTAAILAIAYASVRFPLDFLRLPSSDPRHGGLTAAQWGCIVAFVVALLAMQRLRLTASRQPQRPVS
jgi:phosphatidylglycerol---prolipoprotein diacylglyceryl transferase